MTTTRRGGERGAATVLVVSLSAVLLLVGSGLGVVAAMVVDHRRAQAAADLAALAGASELGRGGDACRAAGAVAERNGGALTGCTLEGRDVLVAVTVSGPRWLGQTGDLSARARAGPASPPE
ncbi:Rv3654c family TadE-like protein [Nocardioides sambongensis]|uniref:Rv3654c family TadE-like protein n=1 Tax=Nocardioides sambongensis TaxID=2589074 RepID=UPI00112C8BAC|nr:Rv3654c family TadE-like protein [Nocardioides sambongensis]